MDKIVSYLEKLGFTVEEQGKLAKYLVVFKAGLPIGFILPDLSVKLVSGAGGQNDIEEIIKFINSNKELESVGASEFLLASYRGNQLTTFYDVKSMHVKFTTYIRDGTTGEVMNKVYENYDSAVFFFVSQTNMINLDALRTTNHESLSNRFRTWLINYLLSKSKQEKAEQR
jgi:hypothetical protein